MSRVLPLSLTLVAMVEVGCTDGPLTAPQPAARVPSTPAAYVGDAPTVPHVMRFEGRTIAGWYDTARNTAIIIGAPLNPTTSRICGGAVRNQFMPLQFVGDLEGVIKELMQNPDATVLVYDEIAASLEEALCLGVPIGRGTGLYMRNDNDFFGTGVNRANAFMEHVNADLVMSDGGKGHVTAMLNGTWAQGGFVHFRTSVVINRQN